MRLKHLILVICWVISLSISAQDKSDLYTKPVFFKTYYSEKYDDVDKETALEHWMEKGLKEGRCASPVFDPKYYLKKNREVAKEIGSQEDYEAAAMHWLKYGLKEGRPSHGGFQVKNYVKYNQDLYKEYGLDFEKLIEHYINIGRGEGRRAKR